MKNKKTLTPICRLHIDKVCDVIDYITMLLPHLQAISLLIDKRSSRKISIIVKVLSLIISSLNNICSQYANTSEEV